MSIPAVRVAPAIALVGAPYVHHATTVDPGTRMRAPPDTAARMHVPRPDKAVLSRARTRAVTDTATPSTRTPRP